MREYAMKLVSCWMSRLMIFCGLLHSSLCRGVATTSVCTLLVAALLNGVVNERCLGVGPLPTIPMWQGKSAWEWREEFAIPRFRSHRSLSHSEFRSPDTTPLRLFMWMCDDHDPIVRLRIAEGLTNYQHQPLEVKKILRKYALTDDNSSVRRMAVCSLGVLRNSDPQINGILRRAGGDECPWVRFAAAQSLFARNEHSHDATLVCIALLRDPKCQQLHWHTYSLLEEYAWHADSALGVLMAFLESPGTDQSAVVRVLARMERKATPALATINKLLNSSDPSLRLEAAFAIWTISRQPSALKKEVWSALASPGGDAYLQERAISFAQGLGPFYSLLYSRAVVSGWVSTERPNANYDNWRRGGWLRGVASFVGTPVHPIRYSRVPCIPQGRRD